MYNRYRHQSIFLTLFLWGFLCVVSGQEIVEINNLRLRHYQLKDGLGTHMAERIIEGSNGIIWIGTYNGLLKYDGYAFIKVVDGKIGAILEDRDGFIWVGSQDNLWRYDPRTQQKRSYYYREESTPDRWYDIVALAQDVTGSICVGTAYNCLVRLVPDGRDNYDIYRYPCSSNNDMSGLSSEEFVRDTLAGNWLWNIVTADNGTTWIGTTDGLSELLIPDTSKPGEVLFKYTKPSFDPYNQVGSFSIRHINRGRDGQLWITALFLNEHQSRENRLFQFDPESRSFIEYAQDLPNHIELRYILEDRKGNLWQGPYADGLQFISVDDIEIIDDQHRVINNYKRYPFTSPGDITIANNNVQGFLEDQFGTIWVLCNFMGIYQIPVQLNTFEEVLLPRSTLEEQNEVSNILTFKDQIWVSTWSNGLYTYNADLEQVMHFKKGSVAPLSNVIPNIFEDSKERLWAFTDQLQIHLYEPDRQMFSSYPLVPGVEHNSPFDFLRAVYEDQKGNFWVGSGGRGLFLFDPDAKKVLEHFNANNPNSHPMHSNNISGLIGDDEGYIWVGSPFQGLARLHKMPDGTYTMKRLLPGVPLIGKLLIDKENRFWITTSANGLLLFDRKEQKIIKSYTVENGFPNNNIYDIAEDQNGFIWLATPTGLIHLNPENDEFQTYEDGYGFNFSQKVSNGIHIDDSNQLLFGGNGKFYRFKPDTSDLTNELPLTIVLNDLRINNELQTPGSDNSVIDTSIQFLNNLRLKYDQNNVEISFAGIQFDDPDNVTYSYILENYFKEWQEIGKDRIARIPNLPPGNYTFKVRATHGIRTAERQLAIQILAPFWLTWWAKTIYFLLGIAIITTYFNFRKNIRNKRMELEKIAELQQLRSRFFAKISHEFRTPLTLIMGPLEERIKKLNQASDNGEFSMMHGQTKRMLKLVDELLDLSKISENKFELNPKSGDIYSFLNKLISPFCILAQGQKITFKTQVPDEVLLLSFDPECIEKVVNNLLSNAFKYADKQGRVGIKASFETQESVLELSVSNDGSPIPASELPLIFEHFYQADNAQLNGDGVGLALVKELVELMNGTVQVSSAQETGTTFIIHLPLKSMSSSLEPVNRVSEGKETAPFNASGSIPLQPMATEDVADIKILVVEDSSELRSYISKLLTYQYRVLEAENGREGLSLARREIPDLIISDVMMPLMDGIELCNKIKSDSLTDHIPVILLTAKVTQQNRIEGLTAGADDYLTKPFSPEELTLRVGNLMNQRKNLIKQLSRNMHLDLSDLKMTSATHRFLEKALEIANDQLDNPDFTVEMYSAAMNLSRTHFFKKLKSVSGQSPSEFMRNLRLQRAAQLIKIQQDTISQIAYSVGFNNLSYFTKCFKDKYKVTPSEYYEHASTPKN